MDARNIVTSVVLYFTIIYHSYVIRVHCAVNWKYGIISVHWSCCRKLIGEQYRLSDNNNLCGNKGFSLIIRLEFYLSAADMPGMVIVPCNVAAITATHTNISLH